MFREMRRNKQLLSEEETVEIFKNATSGVLAVLGDEEYPYAVPVSYVYDDGKIYIHCAKSGHKTDAIKRSDKVSFCVIDKDDIVKEEYTTYFRSAIAFGRASIIEDEKEKMSAIDILASKYYPDDKKENRDKEIEGAFSALCMIRIDIEHMTGKEAKELVNKRTMGK